MSITDPNWMEMRLYMWSVDLLLRPSFRRFVERMQLSGNETVMDFGCGFGACAEYLAGALPSGKVICADISESWLHQAQKRLRKFNNVSYRLGDITQHDNPRGEIDVIIIHHMLHDTAMEERESILQALGRLLKPSGRLVIREPIKQCHGLPAEEIRRLMACGGLAEERYELRSSLFRAKDYEGVYRPQPVI